MIEERTVDVFDYLRTVVRWRKLFILCSFVFAAAGLVSSFLIPHQYRAEATIIARDSGSEGLGGQFSILPMLGGWFPSQSYANFYLGILASYTVAEAIVMEHNLVAVYGSRSRQEAIRSLQRNADIQIDDEGIIHIAVVDRSAERSADVANGFVSQLEQVLMRFEVEKARSARGFIGSRLTEVTEELSKAEEDLRDFQAEHGLVSVSSQVEAAISNWARLRAEIVALEIRKRVAEDYGEAMHPQLSSLNRTLTEMRRSLEGLQFGDVDGDQFAVALCSIPQLELEYARLKREVLIQEDLYQLLSYEYEHARIEESRDTPRLIILDYATAPERRYRPKRVALVFSSTLVGFLVAGVTMVTSEYVRQRKARRHRL